MFPNSRLSRRLHSWGCQTLCTRITLGLAHPQIAELHPQNFWFRRAGWVPEFAVLMWWPWLWSGVHSLKITAINTGMMYINEKLLNIKLSKISKPGFTIAHARISQSSIKLMGEKTARPHHAKFSRWWSSGSRIKSNYFFKLFGIFQTVSMMYCFY